MLAGGEYVQADLFGSHGGRGHGVQTFAGGGGVAGDGVGAYVADGEDTDLQESSLGKCEWMSGLPTGRAFEAARRRWVVSRGGCPGQCG